MRSVDDLDSNDQNKEVSATNPQNDNETKINKAGHPELTKRQKAFMGTGIGLVIFLAIVLVVNTVFSSDPQTAGSAAATDGSGTISNIEANQDGVSAEQEKRVAEGVEVEKNAILSGEKKSQSEGIFSVAISNNESLKTSGSSVVDMNGVSAKPKADEKVEVAVESKKEPESKESQINRFASSVNKGTASGDRSKKLLERIKSIKDKDKIQAGNAENKVDSSFVNGHQMMLVASNGNTQSGSTVNVRNSSNGSSSTSRNRSINLDSAKSNSAGFNFDLSDQAFSDTEVESSSQVNLDGNSSVATRDALSESQASSYSPESDGRGFFIGDVTLGKTKNGLVSTSTSQYLIVDIEMGPLEGAKMVFTPKVEYDNYVFQSNEIQFGKNRASVKAIIVTPDTQLRTGFRSDVDYHTLYKLGMLWVYGMSKGAAELVTGFSNNVTSNDSTTVVTSDYDGVDLLIAGAGGVADAATDIVKQETTIPPTVTVDAKAIVGIMFVEAFNPPWLPVVPDNEYSL